MLVVALLALTLGCKGDSNPAGPDDNEPDPLPTLVISTASLSDGAQTVAYSETLAATGGDGNYTWSLAPGSGPLPAGLTVAAKGVVAGVPTSVESQSFTVQVASGDGQTGQRTLSITVQAPVYLLPTDLCSSSSDLAIAAFANDSLEAAVRAALRVGPGEGLSCGLLSSLDTLSAPAVHIDNLMGAQNLTGLTFLTLQDLGRQGKITDISPLAGLTGLTDLYVDGNNVLDIRPLSGLVGLVHLGIADNPISDISTLSAFGGLQSLQMGRNSVSDISPLSGLTNLGYLMLGPNPIGDISSLSGLANLWFLDCRFASISDISGLSGLTNLRYLSLNFNSITDVQPLGGLTNLSLLDLTTNSIGDISQLGGLTGLTTLRLGDNSISDVSALVGLTELMVLDLSRNSINDIAVLSGMAELMYVVLGQNPGLSDIQPLLDNAGIGSGDEVFLSGTAVSCADVALLEARGVTVLSDCP